MGRSRRKYKKSRAKVRVGLPKKKPGVFKPAFTIPDQLSRAAGDEKWDSEGSVIRNYRAFGVVSNPNILGALGRTPHALQSPDLQLPLPGPPEPLGPFHPIDPGSDLESDDLKSVLGKRRRDGKTAPLQPLTKMQHIHIGRLIDKYGNDYQAMFMDTRLNSLQHSVGTLKMLCKRYYLPPSRLCLPPSK